MNSRRLSRDRAKVVRKSIFQALILFLGVMSLLALGYVTGKKDAQMRHQEELKQISKVYDSALFLTVDSTGAWLGSYPGAKESPLYNHLGEQVGKLKEVTE